MTAKSADPILLTPGPLTTTLQTKEAQLRDYGSRDIAFIDMTANLVAARRRGQSYRDRKGSPHTQATRTPDKPCL